VIEFGSSKNFSIKDSSYSATASRNTLSTDSTSSCKSSGTSTNFISHAHVSFIPNHTARLLIKSTTPLNSSSAPIGSCKGTGLAPRHFSYLLATTLRKSAPARSILLTNPIRATLLLSDANRQLVSDCGSTPSTALKAKTAPSRTRSERFTSTVKST
jgi:hypothetical protein